MNFVLSDICTFNHKIPCYNMNLCNLYVLQVTKKNFLDNNGYILQFTSTPCKSE